MKVTKISKPYIYKAAELGPMLLLNTNRKSYMGSLMALSHFALSDLERSKSRSPKFKTLYNVKEPS